VTVVDHPLAAHRLTQLRDEATDREGFRRALSQLTWLLVSEATRSLPVDSGEVRTPLGPAPARRIGAWPVLVPVLRAGLGMLASALELLPGSTTGFVGLKRDEKTLLPDRYVTAVPDDLGGAPTIVLDPMLATGGSLVHTLGLLTGANAGPIAVCCVLAAPEGVAAVEAAGYGAVHIVTAAVDSHLNDIGFIVPGLGDAGDRQFGGY
jgi:uracil phosphoribosyltransferase